MATPKHGRRGRVYLDGAMLPLIATWTADSPANPSDATSMGDDYEIHTAGIAKFDAGFSGWMDEDTNSVYALNDGADHYCIIYADISSPAGKRHYWKGYMNGSVSTSGGKDGTIKIDAKISAGQGGVLKGYA